MGEQSSAEKQEILKPSHFFFRVAGGENIGKGQVPQIGDILEKVFATDETFAINNILDLNDRTAIRRGKENDANQRVIVIESNHWYSPSPDETWDPAYDYNEVLIEKGVVRDVMNRHEYKERLLKEDRNSA